MTISQITLSFSQWELSSVSRSHCSNVSPQTCSRAPSVMLNVGKRSVADLSSDCRNSCKPTKQQPDSLGLACNPMNITPTMSHSNSVHLAVILVIYKVLHTYRFSNQYAACPYTDRQVGSHGNATSINPRNVNYHSCGIFYGSIDSLYRCSSYRPESSVKTMKNITTQYKKPS